MAHRHNRERRERRAVSESSADSGVKTVPGSALVGAKAAIEHLARQASRANPPHLWISFSPSVELSV